MMASTLLRRVSLLPKERSQVVFNRGHFLLWNGWTRYCETVFVKLREMENGASSTLNHEDTQG